MQTMTIPRRFRGPPNSGNGGYVCGMLARQIAGAAEVTLRAPPPLETELGLVEVGTGVWELTRSIHRNRDSSVLLPGAFSHNQGPEPDISEIWCGVNERNARLHRPSASKALSTQSSSASRSARSPRVAL